MTMFEIRHGKLPSDLPPQLTQELRALQGTSARRVRRRLCELEANGKITIVRQPWTNAQISAA